MTHGARGEAALLFIGDLATFLVALWVTLFIRYQELPSGDVFGAHVAPFTVLFALWLLVFYMAGLYGKRTILFKTHLVEGILKTQSFNIILAAIFFFFASGIGIAPKTNLLIYLVVSLILICVWRLLIYPRIGRRRARYHAFLIGSGVEADELVEEVNGNSRYILSFTKIRAPKEFTEDDFASFAENLVPGTIGIVVANSYDPAVAKLLTRVYELTCLREEFQFVEFADLYEEVFDRIPLSLLSHAWFLQNAKTTDSRFYSAAKRAIDFVGGLLMGLVTLVALPCVFVALRLEGPGPLFIAQDRIGRRGRRIRVYKFRSMRANDFASGNWVGETKNQITKTGAVLRKTSLDEFPQFINVLSGEISLIGPRSDIEGLGLRLSEALAYYNARYLVTPGITGWAQINQQYEPGNISPQSIEETKTRLAYDFYYLKNRSLALDIVIALKTAKRMFFRVSRW